MLVGQIPLTLHRATLTRVCFILSRDASTPSADFLISAHPHCKNLYIATGGGFHSWKMLPVIGNYIIQALEGTLNEEEARRWNWNRFDFDGNDTYDANNKYSKPPLDWKDIMQIQ